MKKLLDLSRRFAAYLVREHLSLYDILMLMTIIRLIDQHRYADAVVVLCFGALVAVLLKSLAGKYGSTQATITNVVSRTIERPDPGFAKRVQDSLK